MKIKRKIKKRKKKFNRFIFNKKSIFRILIKLNYYTEKKQKK